MNWKVICSLLLLILTAFSPASSPPLHIWPRTGIDTHFDYWGTFSDTKSHFERSVAIYSWVTYSWNSKATLSRTDKRQWFVKCVSGSPELSLVVRTTCTELLITPGIRLCIEQSMYGRAPVILNWSFCKRQAEKAETVTALCLAYFPYSLYVLLNCTKSLPKSAWSLLGIPYLCKRDCSGREFLSKLVVLSRHLHHPTHV